jgi:hypothetical protein
MTKVASVPLGIKKGTKRTIDTKVRIDIAYLYLNPLSNSDTMAAGMFSVARQQNTGSGSGQEKQDR